MIVLVRTVTLHMSIQADLILFICVMVFGVFRQVVLIQNQVHLFMRLHTLPWWQNTEDYAYSQRKARTLAINYPNKAIFNADNHEYFAENRPYLNMEPDSDGDGIIDANDAFPNDASESVDTDGDGIGNNADTDDDNDGLTDKVEKSKWVKPFKCL